MNTTLREPIGGASETHPAFPATFDLPLNLAECVDATTLMSWVQEEVHALDGAGCTLETSDCRLCPGCLPKAMLSALCFAYLTGQFDPDEVVSSCNSQLALRILSNGLIFSSGDLSRFRRANRRVLISVLTRILARALGASNRFGSAPLPMSARQALQENATLRVNIGRHMEWDAD
jgi:hypothetical protein